MISAVLFVFIGTTVREEGPEINYGLHKSAIYQHAKHKDGNGKLLI
jgi:hypothetical protein